MGLTAKEEIEVIRLLGLEAQDRLFQPQPGPQTTFLSTTADIAIYGGAAGGGKTYALLLENLRHVGNGKFGSVIFRRESPQITAEGGLWDTARDLYPLRGAKPISTPQLVMRFPSGARVSFRHLQYEDDVLAWQGAQVPLICYDELTHFTRRQFFYMLSRNRSMCGVKPYMRATTNPDADSWVADFVAWWIDQDTGFAIPERSGAIRYFVVLDDRVRWADSREELAQAYGVQPDDAKSCTFIVSSIFDNRILLKQNPGYLADLKAQGVVEQARLLDGNWKIRPAAGMYFPRAKAQIVTVPPSPLVTVARGWDLAATTPTPQNPSPDATAGPMIARMEDGRYIVLDCEHGRWASHDVRMRIKSTAAADAARYGHVRIRLPQDPGQAGKEQGESYIRELAGYPVKIERVTGSKTTRAEPFSAQWQAGNVCLLAGDWNEGYLAEMDAFPTPGAHDDRVDGSSDAFAEVALNAQPAGDVIEPQPGDYEGSVYSRWSRTPTPRDEDEPEDDEPEDAYSTPFRRLFRR